MMGGQQRTMFYFSIIRRKARPQFYLYTKLLTGTENNVRPGYNVIVKHWNNHVYLLHHYIIDPSK